MERLFKIFAIILLSFNQK